jgi:hypothetical protein
LALGSGVRQSLLASTDHLRKQIGYAGIKEDIRQLQQSGRLAPDAVIISPAHGIPWDWSNPLLVDFPSIPYLDTGWSTFSPAYEEALRKFEIGSLPQSLYENDNLYLITESIFKVFLSRYYQEHLNTAVTFETLYKLPNPYHYEGYEDVELYKVLKQP